MRKITTQKEIRMLFWKTYPGLSKRKIINYTSTGKMYTTDTRCAFCDFVDMLVKEGVISERLAYRVTL